MTLPARLRFGLISGIVSVGLILLQPAAVGAATASVTINNYLFMPKTLTVLPGTTITWNNKQEDDAHTVTSDTGAFDSGVIKANGGKFTMTFATAGTFHYHCTIHSTMHGTIVVSTSAQELPPTDTVDGASHGTSQGLPAPIALTLIGAAALLAAGLVVRWQNERR